jgi:hypothetical protein
MAELRKSRSAERQLAEPYFSQHASPRQSAAKAGTRTPGLTHLIFLTRYFVEQF